MAVGIDFNPSSDGRIIGQYLVCVNMTHWEYLAMGYLYGSHWLLYFAGDK